jgi:thiol-disulfide isomerase/thioredoxin
MNCEPKLSFVMWLLLLGLRPSICEDSAWGAILARDEFDGKMNLRWEILHPDPSHYSLTAKPDTLTITTQEGGFAGDATNYKNLFLIPCPGAIGQNLQVTTCLVGFKPAGKWNQAGLVFYDDEDNYLKWDYEYAAWGRMFAAIVETNGRFTIQDWASASGDLDRLWLRVTKRGNQYVLSKSFNGKEFDLYATWAWGDGTVKRIGLFAKNGKSSDAPEVPVSFDFFEIRSVPAGPPATENSRFIVPKENEEIPKQLQPCAENLRKIHTAIEKYEATVGSLPDWLSDLVPAYLSATTLFCPNDPNRVTSHISDLKLPGSYKYQFSPAVIEPKYGVLSGKTYIEWKTRQTKLFGTVVPMVRCDRHSHSLATLNLALNGTVYTSREEWEGIFVPNYEYGMEYNDASLALARVPALPFDGTDLTGKPVRLSDYLGKVVVLDFWATWCGPNSDSIPCLQRIAKENPEVQIVAVSLDSNEKSVHNFTRDKGLPFSIIFDGRGWKTPAAKLYNIDAIPCTYIINKAGRIVVKHNVRDEGGFRAVLAQAAR